MNPRAIIKISFYVWSALTGVYVIAEYGGIVIALPPHKVAQLFIASSVLCSTLGYVARISMGYGLDRWGQPVAPPEWKLKLWSKRYAWFMSGYMGSLGLLILSVIAWGPGGLAKVGLVLALALGHTRKVQKEVEARDVFWVMGGLLVLFFSLMLLFGAGPQVKE